MAINRTIRRTSTRPSEIAVRHSARFIRRAANEVEFGPVGATKGPIGPKTVPPANQVGGLLLMDSALSPISCNDEAIQILSYPDVPENVKHLDVFLTDTIRARLLSRQPPQHSRFVTELVSGRRRYHCRVFHLNRHVRGPSQPVLELLLERSSGSLSLARAAQQFSFSPREQQAVEFLLQGLSSKEIAVRMKISPNTVNTFFRLIMIKMGVSSRSGILAKMITASFDSDSGSLESWRTADSP
jgi:DNA-binding CsgD family transcriptional regulator